MGRRGTSVAPPKAASAPACAGEAARQLHRWRESARGDEAAELALLQVLVVGDVGADQGGTVAERVDARLRGLVSGPAAPGPVPLDLPVPASACQAVVALVSDGADLARGEADEAARQRAMDRLTAVEADFGRIVTPGGPGIAEGFVELEEARRGDAAFWPVYREHQRQVLGLLLRSTPPATLDQSASGRSLFGAARLMQVAPVVASFALLVLLFVLPTRLQGALAPGDLSPRDVPPCGACPGGERLEAVSLHRADGRSYVNVAFEQEPRDAVVRLTLEGAGDLTLVQVGEGPVWGVADPPPAFDPRQILAHSEDRRLVVQLPGQAPIAGVAAASASDRVPSAGAVSPRPGPPARANLVDLAILALASFAALRGARLGLLRGLDLLAMFVVMLVLARLFYPLLAQVLPPSLADRSSVADSMALALAFTVLGVALGLLANRGLLPRLRGLWQGLPLRAGSSVDRWLGAWAVAARAVVTAGGVLVIVVGLAATAPAGGLVEESILGRTLVGAWRLVYGL